MRNYILKRIVQNIITLFLFLTFCYFLIDATPGSFADRFLADPRLTPEMRANLKASLGLDQPTYVRYFTWLGNIFKGDFGVSFSNYPRPVLDVIKERAPRTIVLFLSSTTLAYLIGFVAGKALAWQRGGVKEWGITLGGVALYTVFLPWFALIMIFIWAYKLGLFPLGKFLNPVLWQSAPEDANYVFSRMIITAAIAIVLISVVFILARRLNPNQRGPVRFFGTLLVLVGWVVYWLFSGVGIYMRDILHHMVLPIATLAIVNFSGTMLLTRNSMLETLREDYIMAARSKGLPEKMVRDKHASRNALLPVVTSFILAVAFILDGGVITETTFSWPGMGLTLLQAALVKDIPMVIGALVFTGIIALTAHLIADIMYAFLDPRIRYS
jgi:peptide/nickel transport system permease protein